MQPKQRSQGKFISIAGFRKLRGPSGSPYELLVFDQGWRPVPLSTSGIACMESS